MGYRPLTDSKWGIAPSPTPSGGNLPRSQGVSPLTDSKRNWKRNWNNLEKMFQRMCG